MKRIHRWSIVSVLLIASLAACAAPTATPVEPAAPTAAAPTEAAIAPTAEPAFTLPSAEGYVLGYVTAKEDQKVDGLLKACTETKMECVRGKDIDDLIKQKPDVILAYSDEWDVYALCGAIQNVKKANIPMFILNADSGESPHIYNLSTLYHSQRASLEWMMEEMGGEGEFVYFNFGENGFKQDIINEVLAAYPKVKATSIPASYDKESLTQEGIIAMVKANPAIKAIWTTEHAQDVFAAIAYDLKDMEQPPLCLCPARADLLKAWKETLEANPHFKCFTTIRPGHTDYEGVYAALFYLSGIPFNPQALGGKWDNTLQYHDPIITSENLDEWMGKLDSLEMDEYGNYHLPAMTPEEIRDQWFEK